MTAKPIDLSPLVKALAQPRGRTGKKPWTLSSKMLHGLTRTAPGACRTWGVESDLQATIPNSDRLPGVALSPEQLHDVRQIIAQVIPGAQVWVFGSRATGRARPFSDLDLLLTQPPKLNWGQRAALRDGFEASHLPFRVDIVESGGLAFGVAERIRSERVDLLAL